MKLRKLLQTKAYEPWREKYASYHKLKRTLARLKVELHDAVEAYFANADKTEDDLTTTSNSKYSDAESASSSSDLVGRDVRDDTIAMTSVQSDQRASTTAPKRRFGQLKRLNPRLLLARYHLPKEATLLEEEPDFAPELIQADNLPLMQIAQATEKDVVAILESDVKKVNDFFKLKLTGINQEMLRIRQLCKASNPSSAAAAVGLATSAAADDTPDDFALSQSRSNRSYATFSAGGGARTLPEQPLSDSVDDGLRAASSQQTADLIIALYRDVLRLRGFASLNVQILQKMAQKLDTITRKATYGAFAQRLAATDFASFDTAPQLMGELERLYKATPGIALSSLLLKELGNDQLYLEQSNDLRLIVHELDKQDQAALAHSKRPWKLHWIGIGLLVGLILFFVPILDDNPPAHRCLALLATITIFWVSEAIPFFVTALAIPPIVVLLEILNDTVVTGDPCIANNTTETVSILSADAAASRVFSYMFDHTSALILGGFCISAAFSKYEYELWVAAFIQRHVGHKPKLFLLCFMFLGLFLSLLIGNVAAPILCSGIMLPIIRDLELGSPYARAMVLGLAFACNIGGMLTPISSPQNAVVVSIYNIDFDAWVEMSFPFCLIATIIAWAFLVLALRPNDVTSIPRLVWERKPLKIDSILVLVISFATIILWSTLTVSKPFFGDMGVIAFLPVVVFFATGILDKHDFNSFQWNLIFLIGGGAALGQAVKNSQLLHIVADAIEPSLEGHNLWVTFLAICALVLIISSFISHTVAAIILMPVIVEIAKGLGHVPVLVMGAALMDSASMALPMTSFPNVVMMREPAELCLPRR
ncbi:hypothetical protein, variant [Capsaspora owczarzaki ATCC 30864]|uniref:SPX domain-containing protein n=1 Tax=Capsaspora owczarzaki (strain ATCC 30864) TaxID=595528 RepID=A0A0D2X1F4_CAPO3|nr:hypothetical protein, variant [Capsaspora owczarzaki ATCC 30864]